VEPPRRKVKGGGDSFATFLDAVQRSPQNLPADTAATFVTSILSLYGPQLLSELQVKSGMSFPAFAPLLESMRESGKVTVTGDPGRETVALTAAGTR
jgi:hypothetical protein